MSGKKEKYLLEQGRFVDVGILESEVMLTLSIPLGSDSDRFRVGWDVKGIRSGGYIAISTGRELWSRSDLAACADHILWLLEGVNQLVAGVRVEDRD